MNITAIKVKMMISTTSSWLGSERFRNQLQAVGELGVGVLAQLEEAHNFLADLANRRKAAHAKLRKVIDQIARLDERHDDKARGLYYALDSLIALASTPGERARFMDFKQQLFPLGLRVVRMTHLEESGAAAELDLAVGPELREQLAQLNVGAQSLGQVLDDWIAAGKALGVAVARREELKASLKAKGTAVDTVDIRLGRKRWLHAVRGLQWLLELHPQAQALTESVESALAHAIELSQRQRDQARARSEDEVDPEQTEASEESGGEDAADDEAAPVEADAEAEGQADPEPSETVGLDAPA